MTRLPTRPTLLQRVIQAQGLRNLRDRGRLTDEEFLLALNEIRREEGLPPLTSVEEPVTG